MQALSFDDRKYFVNSSTKATLARHLRKTIATMYASAVASVAMTAVNMFLLSHTFTTIEVSYFLGLVTGLIIFGAFLNLFMSYYSDTKRLKTNPGQYAVEMKYEAKCRDDIVPSTLPRPGNYEIPWTGLGMQVDRCLNELRQAFDQLFDLRQRAVAANSINRQELTDLYLNYYGDAMAQLEKFGKLARRLTLAEQYRDSDLLTPENVKEQLARWGTRAQDQLQVLQRLVNRVARAQDFFTSSVRIAEGNLSDEQRKANKQYDREEALAALDKLRSA